MVPTMEWAETKCEAARQAETNPPKPLSFHGFVTPGSRRQFASPAESDFSGLLLLRKKTQELSISF